jgi:hypothetical protein
MTFEVSETETQRQIIFFKMNILKSGIKLFKISQKLLKFLGQHRILLYLLASSPFRFGPICSLFMVNDNQKP